MNSKLAKATWLTLLYTLAVVAWGGFTRASYSGDGCGAVWPNCAPTYHTGVTNFERMVEMSHRITSAFVGVLVIGLLVWTFRTFARGHRARRASVWVLALTITEGLIGAALVLFGLVDRNDSIIRTISMSLHLVNTFFLLGAMVHLALFADGYEKPVWKGQGAVAWALGVGFFSMLVLGVSGAASALGHMVRPTDNVLHDALQVGAHYLQRLQVLHPLIATSVGLYIVLLGAMLNHLRPDAKVATAVKWMYIFFGVQFGLGLLNIALKAPAWMQVTHLVMADINWMTLVFVAAMALRPSVTRVEIDAETESNAIGEATPPVGARMLMSKYVALTKPRVISLLLFTTMTAMFMAARGWPGFGLFMVVLVGGYLAAGAANAINMVIDRDIDRRMKRTATRPTVTQDIPSRHALAFAGILATVSFGLLWLGANLLTAVLALAGLVFYVVVYTLVLKRRTWHNIVIGGAAGAFPPLVGWASVSNDVPLMAWFLFALIFVWTPVHFWALALLIKDDYAKAGIPMLPVVAGERATVAQILAYAVATAAVCFAPFVPALGGQPGWLYLGAAILLNIVLLVRCAQLWQHTDRPHAVSLYKYSMLYLAILFLVFAVDRSITG